MYNPPCLFPPLPLAALVGGKRSYRCIECGRVFVWWRMGKELPAGVEHAAVAAAVYQGRRSRRRWSPRDGRSGSLQKKICIHGLQRDLLKTVCFWYNKKQIQKCTWLPDKLQLRMIMPYRPCENTDKDGSFTRLTDLRLLTLSGTSHSGGGDSFSPSEPLLKSCMKPLNLASGDGRPSSSFPPGTEKERVCCLLPSGFDRKLVTKDALSNPEVTLTSLFLWRSWFGDILGSRVNDGFGECLALFVFQWSDIGEFQRTKRKMKMST